MEKTQHVTFMEQNAASGYAYGRNMTAELPREKVDRLYKEYPGVIRPASQDEIEKFKATQAKEAEEALAESENEGNTIEALQDALAAAQKRIKELEGGKKGKEAQ